MRILLIAALATVSCVVQAQGQDGFGAWPAVSDKELQASAGKADLSQLSQAHNAATVANNSVNGTSTTGGIVIDGNAMQHMTGLAVMNANTGNNVAINATMNVNIAIIRP